MHVVGLTGGIATGKSAVAGQLARAGLSVVDCDALAHEATEPGTWGYARVLRSCRPLLLPDGHIDRAALRMRVAADPALRRKLNRATHLPIAAAIIAALLRCWLKGTPVVVLDAPLLFETSLYRVASIIVVVSCGAETQLRRLMARDSCSREDAEAMIAAQLPVEQKCARADIVLHNNGSLQNLAAGVEASIPALMALPSLVARLLSFGVLTAALTTVTIAAVAYLVAPGKTG
eukprot:SM000352S13426  [mRNA]  locus=s352:37128:38796:- [translate_table: standard]